MLNLNTVIINNFRNIEHAKYDLEKLNIFYGPNTKGKTNTILAIYWALNDYLIDGSSDYASFKPHHQKDAEVSVELIFDSFTFKKTYQENWVKKRGSSEVTLEGHNTEYYVDGVKYAVNEGKKQLLEKLGLSDIRIKSKIDITRAVTDPYYLAQNVAWKDLRAFIIDLVGDVSDEAVLTLKPEYQAISQDLRARGNNVPELNKFYKQQIALNKKEIEENKVKIVGFKEFKDVSKGDLDKANSEIERINQEIQNLKAQATSKVNPEIVKLEKAIVVKQLELINQKQKDNEHLVKLNEEHHTAIDKLTGSKSYHQNELNDITNQLNMITHERTVLRMQIDELRNQITHKQAQQQALRESWIETSKLDYHSNMSGCEVHTCPNCSYVLNQEDIDKAKQQDEAHKLIFVENRTKKLADIEVKGKQIKEDIDNLQFKLNDLDTNYNNLQSDSSKQDLRTKLENELIKLEEDIKEAKSNLVTFYESDESKAIDQELQSLEQKLVEAKSLKIENNLHELIKAKNDEKVQFAQVIAVHDSFMEMQRQITKYEKLIDDTSQVLIEYESKLMALEDFIRTKLSMLKDNVKKVFGDLEFVLVESNIKEGSYNEVCYPLILNSRTAFVSGSGAEKIYTGFYLIEKVKQALSLKDLPIIFDEVDKIDSKTLKEKLITNSQIITTKVDDINYNDVTLIKQ